MRKIKPAVIRFPGGCFADSYDWRDGIGPAAKRPRSNFWDGAEGPNAPAAHRYDPNRFGTNEFVQLCNLTGSQPYLAANVRSLPAEAFYRGVEYCNSPAGSTTLADMRAALGSRSHSTSVTGGQGTSLGAVAATSSLATRKKVAMANCVQLINCLNSLYLAHEDRFLVTPVGHVFAMYVPYQGGNAIFTIFTAPPNEYAATASRAGSGDGMDQHRCAESLWC